MKKRLAINKSGCISYCQAREENIGKYRCDHIGHINNGESVSDFVDRMQKEVNYIEVSILNNLLDMNGLNLIPRAKTDGDLIILEPGKSFGSSKMPGNQFKGDLILDRDGVLSKIFVKLDSLSPSIPGEWKHGLDYSNSSISEVIFSNFISSISNMDIDSVEYSFSVFNFEGEDLETGTLSKNFKEDFISEEIKIAPSTERERDSNLKVTFEEYADGIVDERDNKKVLDNMVDFFTRYRVDREVAKNFILKQAALDLVLGNEDRRGNPGNFIFLVPFTSDEKVKPLNLDYGRCLQIMWTKTTEERIKNKSDRDEIIDEIATDACDSFSGGGIFSRGNLKDSVNFLLENGLEPFVFDKDKFMRSFEDMKDKISKNSINLKYYLEVKKSFVEKLLEKEEIKKIIRVQ